MPANLPNVHGDRNLLSQVFLNLLLNALDAVQKGGRIQVTAEAAEPGFVAMDVTDNGSGIPAHVIGSIFDPFFTTKATGQGTGLGLSMSRGIVRQHGGEIRVQQRARHGIDLQRAAAGHPGGRRAVAGSARGDHAGTRRSGARRSPGAGTSPTRPRLANRPASGGPGRGAAGDGP